MNRLTPEERRRVRLAQQRADERLLTSATPPEQTAATGDRRWRRWMKAMAIAALIGGGGLLASQTLEFHPPTSLMEALLPQQP
jgi:hypothetical protein